MSSPESFYEDCIKYGFEADDETYFPYLNAPFEEHHITRRSIPHQERRIAGSKRVARYQSRQGYKGSGRILQSITAHPALSTRSFEVCHYFFSIQVIQHELLVQELRLECYAQSVVAQGRPPASVDAARMPAAVIPPLFNAYLDETDDILPNEITMAD